MKRENRILGMILCIALIFMGVALFSATVTRALGLMLIMFSAGYGLRETLERSKEE